MPSPLSILRYSLITIGFCALWLGLHWLAAIFEAAPGASIWYAARGLSLALLLVFGLHYAPALFISSLLGGIGYHLPEHPGNWLGVAGFITLTISLTAWCLRYLEFSPFMRLRDAIALIVLGAVAAFITACGVVWISLGSGFVPVESFGLNVLRFFIGDYIGILIVVPLVVLVSAARSPADLWQKPSTTDPYQTSRYALEGLLIFATGAALLWLAIGNEVNTHGTASREHWYLLLLPLAIAAVRFGPLGAALATMSLSAAVVVAAQRFDIKSESTDLQLLILSFAAMSLLLSSAVTDRQRSQAALAAMHRNEAERARREAEQSRLSKARFLAATTHDLRPPFEAVRLGLETLRLHDLPPDAKKVLQQTKSAARVLSEVFESVLDTARLEGEIRTAEPRCIPLDPLLRQIAAEATASHPLAEQTIRIRSTKQHVVADPVLLARLLRNLVANAIQASYPTGRVLLGVRRIGVMLRLEVHDTGHGIEAERLPSIFEPFVTGFPGGAGIGLSLVHEITDQLGANLTVHSRISRGTSFTLELPIAAESAANNPRLRSVMATFSNRVIAISISHQVRRQLLTAVLDNWGAAVLAEATTAALQHQLEQLGSKADLLIVDSLESLSNHERRIALQIMELPSATASRALSADLATIISELQQVH